MNQTIRQARRWGTLWVLAAAVIALVTTGALGYIAGKQTSPQPSSMAGAMSSETIASTAPSLAATMPAMASTVAPRMSMDPMTGGPYVPPVRGYYADREIRFIHTEASDPQVASMLTSMMTSPVIFVPRLKDVPYSTLAYVYVFANGIKGGGPLGFQTDVFDSSPRDINYSPLRRLNLVTWKDGGSARELKSAQDIQAAEAKGELNIAQPGVVVNMPMLNWPGGQR